MKRVLLLSLTALAACAPAYLESGRYACEPGEPAQCPGAWRCGLEGYCHRLGDTTVAWRCATNDDCENHFTCGLSASGDARQCHDPLKPKAWPCETNGDCVADWSCGLAAGGDRRECHDPANPRAWTCVTDDDCLGGWRCASERVCVDPSADALGRLVLAGLDAGVQLNSLGSKSPIRMLSVSQFFSTAPARDRGNLAYVQDGHLRAMSLNAIDGWGASYDLGTQMPVALIAHGARGEDLASGVPDERERVSALWPDGGMTTYSFEDGGLFGTRDHGNNSEAYDLFGQGVSVSGLEPSMFAVATQPGLQYARVRGEWSFGQDLFTIQGADFYMVPNNRIRSIAGARHAPWLECVYVVDERGLWVSQTGGTTPGGVTVQSYYFEPVSLGGFTHSQCVGQGPKVTSVRTLDDRWLAVTAQEPTGPVQVAMLDAARTLNARGTANSPVYCGTATGAACDLDDRVQIDVAFGPCAACPAGSTFLGMSAVVTSESTTPGLEVVCGQAGSPGAVFHLSGGTAGVSTCTRRLITGGSSYFTAPSPQASLPVSSVVAWGGAAGQLWLGATSTTMASVAFDRAPTGMARRSSAPDDFFAFTAQLVGTPSPVVGLASRHWTAPSAAVTNAPSLVILGEQLLDLTGTTGSSPGRTLGYIPSGGLAAPVSASLTATALGSHLVVVSAGATLYAGDVEQVIASSGPIVSLTQRLSTVEPIIALAFPKEHAASGPYLAGYAIVGSNLVRLVADTLTRWRTEAVPLPPNLAPRSTWFQGTKGRVGLYDGAVLSLPSKVPIATALPGGEAVDFAQTCGQQLALAPDGLFRLESDTAAPIGHWVRIPLPSEVARLDFTDGRVHGLGNEVFVFTRTGEAARLTFDSCPAE